MKTPWLLTLILALSTAALSIDDAEARRLGGGRSLGMQRQIAPAQRQTLPPSTAPRQATPAPANAQPQGAPTAQPAPNGWRRWAAPLAGLAAGLGLAALMSHFGLGGEFAGLLLAVLAVLVVVALLRRAFAGKQVRQAQPAYAGEQAAHYGEAVPAHFERIESAPGGDRTAHIASAPAAVPADFDITGFLHHAKVNFVRLQSANDTCNLDDIRTFTTPEMFAEIKLAIDDRGCTPQKTDVIRVDAELLEVTEDAHQHVASVRYHGLVREERDAAPQAFDEVWNLVKPADGSRGWSLAGIQQLN